MSILQAIFAGWHIALKHKRILLLFYLANLFFALLAALPVYMAARDSFNFSRAGVEMSGTLNAGLLIDFIFANFDYIAASAVVFVVVASLYLLLNIFLTGGTIAAYIADRERYEPALFWGNAGFYFYAFVRLLLSSLPLYAVMAFILYPGLKAGFTTVLRNVGLLAYLDVAHYAAIAITLTVSLCIPIIIDFARVQLVVTGERHVFDSLRKATRTVAQNLRKTYGLLILFALIGIFFLLLYSFLSDLLYRPALVDVVFLLILQQLYLLIKMQVRLTYYGSLVAIYPHLTWWLPADLAAREARIDDDGES